MVDFRKIKCRNCKHYHGTVTHKYFCWAYLDDTLQGNCGCTNFESCDNLIYLEDKYEKQLQKG